MRNVYEEENSNCPQLLQPMCFAGESGQGQPGFPMTRGEMDRRRWMNQLSDAFQRAESSLESKTADIEDRCEEMEIDDDEVPATNGTMFGSTGTGCSSWSVGRLPDALSPPPPPPSFSSPLSTNGTWLGTTTTTSERSERRPGDLFLNSPLSNPSKRLRIESDSGSQVMINGAQASNTGTFGGMNSGFAWTNGLSTGNTMPGNYNAAQIHNNGIVGGRPESVSDRNVVFNAVAFNNAGQTGDRSSGGIFENGRRIGDAVPPRQGRRSGRRSNQLDDDD